MESVIQSSEEVSFLGMREYQDSLTAWVSPAKNIQLRLEGSPARELISNLLDHPLDTAGELLIGEIASMLEEGSRKYVVGKIGAMKDAYFMERARDFIAGRAEGAISSEQLADRIWDIENNPKKFKKEMEYVLLVLSQTADERKAYLLGRISKSYAIGLIDTDMFYECSEVLNRMIPSDLDTLEGVIHGRIKNTSQCQYYSASRLAGLGLIIMKDSHEYANGNLVLGATQTIKSSQFGITFCCAAGMI